MSSLAARGRSIVLVTHDPSEIVPAIDRIILLRGGGIFRDGGGEVLTEENLSALVRRAGPARSRRKDGYGRGPELTWTRVQNFRNPRGSMLVASITELMSRCSSHALVPWLSGRDQNDSTFSARWRWRISSCTSLMLALLP